MAALLTQDAEQTLNWGGWQQMRQQLFGERRQREAEDRLITLVTELHMRLTSIRGSIQHGAPGTPQGRMTALEAVLDAANGILAWHREQLEAARIMGWWDQPLPEVAAGILVQVTETHPLFEAARTDGRSIECRDVLAGVAQVRGVESDAFFNDALDGVTSIFSLAVDRLGADAPTSASAQSLNEMWQEALNEVRSLAAPRLAQPAISPEANAYEPAQRAEAPSQFTRQPVDIAVAPPRTIRPAPIRSAPRPKLAARFSRFELVAC